MREVETLKNTLVSDQSRSVRQVDESRVRVDEFVVENRRIMDRLRQAENYIQEL